MKTFREFLREGEGDLKKDINRVIRIINNSMDDWRNHQEEMSYEGGEEEQDFIYGVEKIRGYLESMLDADKEKLKSIRDKIENTLDDMEENDAGMRQNFKYNKYYNSARKAEDYFWREIVALLSKI